MIGFLDSVMDLGGSVINGFRSSLTFLTMKRGISFVSLDSLIKGDTALELSLVTDS